MQPTISSEAHTIGYAVGLCSHHFVFRKPHRRAFELACYCSSKHQSQGKHADSKKHYPILRHFVGSRDCASRSKDYGGATFPSSGRVYAHCGSATWRSYFAPAGQSRSTNHWDQELDYLRRFQQRRDKPIDNTFWKAEKSRPEYSQPFVKVVHRQGLMTWATGAFGTADQLAATRMDTDVLEKDLTKNSLLQKYSQDKL